MLELRANRSLAHSKYSIKQRHYIINDYSGDELYCNSSCLFPYIFFKKEVETSLMSKFPWTTDFPGGSHGKVSAYSVGDLGSIPGSGRSPGEGNGNPLAWWAKVHGVTKSRTRLSNFTFTLLE